MIQKFFLTKVVIWAILGNGSVQHCNDWNKPDYIINVIRNMPITKGTKYLHIVDTNNNVLDLNLKENGKVPVQGDDE